MSSASEITQRLWRADSVVVLFGAMATENLSLEEQIAIGAAQSQAVDEWLAAYAEFKSAGGTGTAGEAGTPG